MGSGSRKCVPLPCGSEAAGSTAASAALRSARLPAWGCAAAGGVPVRDAAAWLQRSGMQPRPWKARPGVLGYRRTLPAGPWLRQGPPFLPGRLPLPLPLCLLPRRRASSSRTRVRQCHRRDPDADPADSAGWEFSQSLQLHFRRRPRCPDTARQRYLSPDEPTVRHSVAGGATPFLTGFRQRHSGAGIRQPGPCTRHPRCPDRRWPRNGRRAGPRQGRRSSTQRVPPRRFRSSPTREGRWV